jgi:hypothetical protein
MVLPSIFGSRQGQSAGPVAAAAGPDGDEKKDESKRQAKLRARMEKGDKRVQQVNARR